MRGWTHKTRIQWVVTALLIVWSLGNAQANPLDSFGIGARSIALGGAATAAGDDSSVNYYNPALLTKITGLQVDVGYVHMKPRLTLNGGDLDVDRHSGLQIGVVLPRKIADRTLAVSVGMFLPDARVTRIRALPDYQPRFVLFDNRPQRLVVTTSVALEIIKGFSIGAGLNFMSDAEGMESLKGTINLNDPEQTTLLGSVDVDFASVRYPTLGATITPSKNWTLGFSYREHFELNLNLGIDVQGEVVTTPAPGQEPLVLVEDASFVLVSNNTNLFSPRHITVGIMHEQERFLVSADVSWVEWSAFPTPSSRVEIDLNLEGLDVEVPPLDRPEPPGFKDIIVPRVGFEYQAVRSPTVNLALRSGYFYEPSPVPAQRALTNFADGTKHGFSFGIGLETAALKPTFPNPIQFDIVAQYIHLMPRTIQKDNPADLIGDYRAGGYLFGGSATMRLQF
ncbi:MAG: hypothetical protein CMH54_05205 [Myxococcales bacterium]|nr:hypothetical protein [Myxococcales bacterium]